jgi:hypothetical protein
MFDARKPFFFSSGDEHPITHERSRRIMKITRDPQNIHRQN